MSNLIRTTRGTLTPFTGFREIEERLNRAFNGCPSDTGTDWAPSVDLHETDDAYVIEADLPGVKKEDIHLTVVDGLVTLKGVRNEQQESKGNGFRRVERSYGSFQRVFRIPGGVDSGKVEAKYEHGVLTATLPKPEQSKPKQIEVKVN